MAKKKRPETVMKEWNSIPKTKRNGRLGQRLAKQCGMRSIGEVRCACELNQLKRNKKIKKWEYEAETWKYQYEPQEYTPDFRVWLNGGDRIYIEYKGKMTKEIRKKMLAVIRCNPDKQVYMNFERANNKIVAGSKTTYEKWCEKNGIECSEQEIKEEWIKN